MKVVSPGGQEWSLIVCTRCKTQHEITEEDIYRAPNEHGGYGYSESYHVCCTCSSQITLSNLPEEVQRRAVDQCIFEMRPQKLSLREVSDFPKKGVLFKDISPLLRSPREFKQLIQYLAGYWQGKVDSIGGFDARGFIFASALAYEMGLPFFMLRKKGKLPGSCKEVSYNLEYGQASLEIQDNALERRGERVLLIDDLLATGGTALAGCRLIESLGGEIAGVQFVIELKALAGREALEGYKVLSVLSY